MSEFPAELTEPRSESRRFLAPVVITATVALALGHVLRQPAMMGANDISRWCTVWSLLERGSYEIDECPWLADTQDKVERSRPGDSADAPKHYYSSKPALLSTLIAGVLYPARRISGVPLDRVVLQEREERWVQKPDEEHPGKVKGVLERPTTPAKWPAYVFYFDAALILFNIIPFGIFLLLYARALDRYARSDWAWYFSLVAAALGTYLLPFTQTLNNHTVAAFSAFFALYQFLRIWDDGQVSGWRFAGVGFFSAFTAVNEIPALAFATLAPFLLLLRFPRKTLYWLVPAAAIPFVASLVAQYAALGELKLVYTEFGTESYLWEGSLWKTPLELDALNLPWFDPAEAARRGITGESYGLYLFHMTLGHHGFWSLTPIFFFCLVGMIPLLGRPRQRMAVNAWMTLILSVVLFAFYTWNPKARNYGGSTQGLRWLFWLIPFWLLLLPGSVEAGQRRGWVRTLALLALGVSAVSVGYAMRNPWSHPWILDALEHL
ncbi:MAG: hypothetical protein ACP5XB_09540, partial [Isosphaeraceae bacterium]